MGPLGGLSGGSVAYAAATVAVALGLLIPSLRRNVMNVSGENARWFVYSGIFVAAAQGFLYSALAVAPIMLVVPLLQLSLVFRFLFALLLNPHHEVFGFLVVFGSVVSIAGACAVSVDTDLILQRARDPGTPRRLSALAAVSLLAAWRRGGSQFVGEVAHRAGFETHDPQIRSLATNAVSSCQEPTFVSEQSLLARIGACIQKPT